MGIVANYLCRILSRVVTGPGPLYQILRKSSHYPPRRTHVHSLHSPENLRRSVTNVNRVLRGKKKVDLFECSRVDHNYPIEETIRNLKVLRDEGLFDHIGMSECSAETLRRANAVHPIAAVEIEVNPWSMEPETRKVIATAQELDIAVCAYS